MNSIVGFVVSLLVLYVMVRVVKYAWTGMGGPPSGSGY
jgi:hypothetical protein